MLQTFLAELKRRKVLRVLGAYAVVAWGALQVADKLFPALMLPQWTITFVAVLLLIGLPITAIITWAFEITPDGIRRTPADADIGAAPARATWIEAALLIAIVAAVGISIAQLERPQQATTAVASSPAAPAATGPAAVENSIAVLPFTSFSDDADSNYFADGLTEELINDLAHIDGLKVSGRTSSFYYKNRNEDLREIGRTLGVAQVLEGSVRRSGDKLRITVQLISTADGFHLWSQTYDRAMNDIFAIQDDVAENVASMLEMKLGSHRSQAPDAMHDGEDYRLYLIASALLHERAREPLTQARELFAQLKDRAPDNVDALAGYTQATMLLAGAFMTIEFEPAAKDAIAAVERALAIDPDSVHANVAAGDAYTVLLHRTDEARYRELAQQHLSRAVAIAPEDPEALAAYGTLLNEMGRYEDSYAELSRAVARDPLSRLAQAQLIFALEGLGRLAEARERLLLLMKMYPDYVFAQSELGELLLEQGQIDAAVPYLKKAHEAKTSPRAAFALANAYQNLGLDEQLRATLDEITDSPLSRPFGEVIALNVRGDDTATFRLAQTQLAKTNDPIWRAMLINAALLLGDLPTVRRELMQTNPALLTTYDGAQAQPESALFAGELLMREGHTDEGKRVLETLLASQAPPAHGYDRVSRKLTRAKALALLGRGDAAMEELRAAQLQGNRLLWDFDYFQRMDHLTAFASLRKDPRFVAMIAEIEADNRAMRDRLLQQSQAAKEG
jgi:TolB-like protein